MYEYSAENGYIPVIIKVFVKKSGIVLEELSLVTFDKTDGKIIAVGNDAEPYQKSSEGNLVTLCPLRWGSIADYTVSLQLFRYILDKAVGKRMLPGRKPKIAVSIPASATEVERKAFMDVFYQAGAGEVILSDLSFEETKNEFSSSGVYIGIIQTDVGIVG